jgi:transglutaminase-like putative cysteine protease
VCQDFAHLMIGCLRSVGLSARYVSGYILTDPPPGRPRLIGADASHAWVSVYCGDQAGWVDIDPTNDCLVDDEHVTLGWGRDFGDVTPMRGVILGGGEQELEVRVTVTPVDTVHGHLTSHLEASIWIGRSRSRRPRTISRKSFRPPSAARSWW